MRTAPGPESEPASWQRASQSVPEEVWDVLVIGAGPAGAVAALHLAANRYRVLLLDRKQFPRDKACGDGLLPDAQGVLRRAGLLERAVELGHRLERLSVYSPSGIECQVRGNYLTLRRRVLDALVAQGAVVAGAVFCRGDVARVDEGGDGLVHCSLAGSDRSYRARVGVIATGANLDLVRQLAPVAERAASGVALRCYVRSSLNLSSLVVCYDRRTLPGYSWIFPLGHQEYNLGSAVFYGKGRRAGGNLRAAFRNFTRGFPLARALFRHGEFLCPPTGALLRCGLRGPASPARQLLVIGETAGTTYPSTGEGIGKAMEMGELAAQTIHEALRSSRPELLREFPLRLERLWRPYYQGYELAARWLSRRWLTDLIAWRTRRSPFFRDAVAAVLNESCDPRGVFSWRAILRSFSV
jgi:geranylgeranyl reductase family protein